MTPTTNPAPVRLAVGIATTGRRELVTQMVRDLARQTRLPDMVLIGPAQPGDVDAGVAGDCPFPVTIVAAPRGLTRQRNAILAAASSADLIVFMDDDFVPHDTYLAQVATTFAALPDVSVLTGRVLADGIHGPGLTVTQAREVLAEATPDAAAAVRDTYGGYGCNMSFRMASVRQAGARFDERLPLYGWQEDIDFSRQLAAAGRIVQADALLGVHLGSKSGRQSGVRFGYSQIANPLYLRAKGTMGARYALRLMSGNVAANLGRMAFAEPHVDRLGRARGNLLALFDLLRGRMRPERILEL